MTATRDLILHIGHFKTGTTALQVFFEANRAALAAEELVYAETGLNRSKHSELAFSVLKAAGVEALMFGYEDKIPPAALWSQLLAEARALPQGHALLISSEEFIRFGAHPGAMTILRGHLAETADLRIRAVAYLRPPQAHLESYYNQLIKMGMPVAGFDGTVLGQLEPVHWDYAQAIHPWVDLLGPENVVLRQFADDLRQGDRLFRDFFAALDRRLPESLNPPEGDINPRLDASLLPINRVVQRARLKPRAERLLRSALQESLLAERGEAGGVDFDLLRDQAEAGIEALARLPHSGIDPDVMKAALPRPQPPEDRLRDEMTAMLLGEIISLREQLAQQGARLAALEAAGGEAGNKPRRRGKQRKDPQT